MYRNNRRAAWLSAIVVLLLASVFSPRPERPGLWLQSLLEWLHVPVFGLISVTLLLLTPGRWPDLQRYAFAFFGALLLGVLTEAIQIPMQRDAAWEDIIADGMGAASFLAAAFAVGRRPLTAALLLAGALAVLIISAFQLISITQASFHQAWQFPIIFGGGFPAERPFLTEKNAHLTTDIDPTSGRKYTTVKFYETGRSGLELRDVARDWSRFTNLKLEIDVEGDDKLDVILRVNDKLHRRGDQPHDDRFNELISLKPGFNAVTIPLEKIRNAPSDRVMDLANIDAIVIFSSREPGRVFRLYEIRLD